MKAKKFLCSCILFLSRLLLTVLVVSVFVLQTNAQELGRPFVHVFPQFVDGRFPDGSYYKSAIQIVNYSHFGGECTLLLYGMNADFGVLTGAATMSFQLRSDGFNFTRTNGVQTFQRGWATVNCTVETRVTITYSFYAASGQIVSEAAVFQNPGFNIARFVADEREGGRLGLALANQNPTDWNVTITVITIDGTVLGSATIPIPARQSVAKFIDEFLPASVGGRESIVMVQIDPGTTSGISAVGFRFTGLAFTTIPIS